MYKHAPKYFKLADRKFNSIVCFKYSAFWVIFYELEYCITKLISGLIDKHNTSK